MIDVRIEIDGDADTDVKSVIMRLRQTLVDSGCDKFSMDYSVSDKISHNGRRITMVTERKNSGE
jgi:hypothetical protein